MSEWKLNPLDKDGLIFLINTLWKKIKGIIPTKTSQLTNDSGFAVPGTKAGIWTDNEGENVKVIAPDGTTWGMDANAGNGAFRFFKCNPLKYAFTIDKQGTMYPTKIGTIGFAKTAKGNAFTSASGAILLSHFYAICIDGVYILKLDGRISKEPDVRTYENYTALLDKQYILNQLGLPSKLNVIDSRCQYFDADGLLFPLYNENGGTLIKLENGWLAARYYSNNMNIGGWPTSEKVYDLNVKWHVEAVLG